MSLVPEKFLTQVFQNKRITFAEEKVLRLALEGRSGDEIQKMLGDNEVKSPAAVRQRLQSVYNKFFGKKSNDDKTPRNISRLQRELVSLYKEEYDTTKIRILYFRPEDKSLAIFLRNNFFNSKNIDVWEEDLSLSSQLILKGEDFIICCLTSWFPSPTLVFKVAYILGLGQRLGLDERSTTRVRFLRLNELKGPLAEIPAFDAKDKEKMVELLYELLGECEKDKVKLLVDEKFSSWMIEVRRSRSPKTSEQSQEESFGRRNQCLELAKEIYQDQIKPLFEVTDLHYFVPATLYPHILICLQKYEVEVKALALVDHEEHFWSGDVGREIASSARENSKRVFVFIRREDLERNLKTLIEHAKAYEVFVTSYQELAANFPRFSKDFSIIKYKKDNSQILAQYHDEEHGPKMIYFTPHDEISKEITIHESALDRIIERSVSIREIIKDLKNIHLSNTKFDIKDNEISSGEVSELVDEINRRVFPNSATNTVGRKEIEMSAYIDINDYDQHEEKHAYYSDMMDRMIEIILNIFNKEQPRNYRILELGAGTGIFTKRLITKIKSEAECPNIEVVALEIDWACYCRLIHNLSQASNIQDSKIDPVDRAWASFTDSNSLNTLKVIARNEDSCIYQESGRKFDCIISSFSDHHIKPIDKRKYFENVSKNLKPQGIMIVGDEFLRPHDEGNPKERELALNAYHLHIIGLAEQAGEKVLAKLERDALQSGLNEIGDFKVSCRQYENCVVEASFTFEAENIGPQGEEAEIGGVYIYKIKRN